MVGITAIRSGGVERLRHADETDALGIEPLDDAGEVGTAGGHVSPNSIALDNDRRTQAV